MAPVADLTPPGDLDPRSRLTRGSGTIGVRVLPDANAVGEAIAAAIVDDMQRVSAEKEKYLLGCPAGRTFIPTFTALARRAGAARVDWSRLVVVMMDEYVEEVGVEYRNCSEAAHYSCRRFGRTEIVDRINGVLAPGIAGIPPAGLWAPDPRQPETYDLAIAEAGGVDVFLVASGASDGHVAFNPPGTDRRSRTRVIELVETTRADNLETFPDFDSLAAVPRFGVSVGLGTIADRSRKVIMALTGRGKRLATRRLCRTTGMVADWPASFIHECRDKAAYFDRDAFAGVDDLWLSSGPASGAG